MFKKNKKLKKIYIYVSTYTYTYKFKGTICCLIGRTTNYFQANSPGHIAFPFIRGVKNKNKKSKFMDIKFR